MKKCFVIMPYGGSDPEKFRHFEGVYQSIICPAARAAGYEPKRSDLEGAPGNITHDIIRDLAEADIVVADLTSANPNVFFELGIRHAFRKSGTVHIVQASRDLAFDVRQYRVIEYSTDLADVPDVLEKIKDAILRRASQPERPDNPVHDALPGLPFDIMMAGDEALRAQLRSAQGTLEQLHIDNESLTKRLVELDPSGEARDIVEVNVDSLLDEADGIMKTTGPHALLRLRQAIDANGADVFVRELRGVLKSPYLDQNDFMEIVLLCKQAGLDGHRRATLEVARRRYPHSNEIFLAFIDALDDSPNQTDQERGRLMLEERMGIVHEMNGPRFKAEKISLPKNSAFGILFNFYNRLNRQDWILSVTDTVPESIQSDSLILRNRARALAKSGRISEAQVCYEETLKLDPTDDQTLAWFGDFLDDQGRFTEAYAQLENAILADPSDGNLYLSLAINIFNRGYYRSGPGTIEGPLPRKSRSRAAVPFVIRGIQVTPRKSEIIQRAVQILVRADAVSEAEALAKGQTPDGKYDTTPLEHVVQQIESQSQDLRKRLEDNG